jgi:hypothetical protein
MLPACTFGGGATARGRLACMQGDVEDYARHSARYGRRVLESRGCAAKPIAGEESEMLQQIFETSAPERCTLDPRAQIRLFGKLKLANCARAGDRAGLLLEGRPR